MTAIKSTAKAKPSRKKLSFREQLRRDFQQEARKGVRIVVHAGVHAAAVTAIAAAGYLTSTISSTAHDGKPPAGEASAAAAREGVTLNLRCSGIYTIKTDGGVPVTIDTRNMGKDCDANRPAKVGQTRQATRKPAVGG